MVNNYDWTASLSTIDFLRDVGKHFPVNRMLARDTVRKRLEDGISYTEFSYVLLQSMDYLNLHRDHGVTLQFGGSDQWGNITGRRRADPSHRRRRGCTRIATPLVTRADGTKYGKTEGGALWLDPEMLSPYAFYQFWLNAEDDKVGELLRVVHVPLARGDRGPRGADGREAVPARRARRRWPSTSPRWCTAPRRPSRSRRRPRRCSAGARSPSSTRPPWPPRCGRPGAAQVQAPPTGCRASSTCWWPAGLSKSKGEARRTVGEGGAYLNNERVDDPDLVPGGGRPARRLLAGAAARQEEPRRRGGRGVSPRAVRRRAGGSAPPSCCPRRCSATSARGPRRRHGAARPRRPGTGTGSCPACCATSPTWTPRRRCSGRPVRLPVAVRAHDDAARCAPRRRGGDGARRRGRRRR